MVNDEVTLHIVVRIVVTVDRVTFPLVLGIRVLIRFKFLKIGISWAREAFSSKLGPIQVVILGVLGALCFPAPCGLAVANSIINSSLILMHRGVRI
jgi:hypothetical protein